MTDSTVRALELLEAQRDLRKCSAIDSYFPAGGPLSRELYAKHMDFFAAGLDHRERAFIAANRVGKTLAGSLQINATSRRRISSLVERSALHSARDWLGGR